MLIGAVWCGLYVWRPHWVDVAVTENEVIDHRAYPKPDSRYGVSKVFGEALASLYADKLILLSATQGRSRRISVHTASVDGQVGG